MDQLRDLCEEIGLSQEVTDLVLDEGEKCPFSTEELYTRLSESEGERAVRESLAGDRLGLKMLACMLLAGLESRERYREKGIAPEIFTDTFRCFPRFVEEHRASFGCYGFDRSFWTCRQIGLRLFRLGELEYEMVDRPKRIDVHIPSAARLTPESCRDSYRRAKEFFRTYFPDYGGAEYRCESWLLSPALDELLPPTSNIRRFQQDYRLTDVQPEDDQFIQWVYQKTGLPLEELPENTSLQRSMKAYLRNGGKIGSATGVLLR